jgi:calcium-dependent protein kinase
MHSKMNQIHFKVVHRDIKPENYLFKTPEEDSQLALIDFGLSQRIGPNDFLSTCCGTVQYISPEQIRGRYRFTGDIWAVGVICYLLLTGEEG